MSDENILVALQHATEEIERLRAALERIANHEPKDDWSWYELRDIARKEVSDD